MFIEKKFILIYKRTSKPPEKNRKIIVSFWGKQKIIKKFHGIY